jgi:molecular chaperone DnaK
LTDAEIKRMRDEAAANEASDKAAREKVDKLNQADSLIFQTEKQLKEFGDKLPADKKGPIEDALAKLKTAHASQDIAAIDAATAELNAVFQAASQEMYNAQAASGPQGEPQGGQQANAGGGNKQDGEVTDVDFEEVK